MGFARNVTQAGCSTVEMAKWSMINERWSSADMEAAVEGVISQLVRAE